jgi:hypothetical protein
LKNSNTIRRFTAAIFLLLFAFCVTPKRFLHDLLANHRDMQSTRCLPVEQIAASGFHCNIDELVVVAPFLPVMQTCSTILSSLAAAPFSELLPSVYFFFTANHEGRGPPAVFYS